MAAKTPAKKSATRPRPAPKAKATAKPAAVKKTARPATAKTTKKSAEPAAKKVVKKAVKPDGKRVVAKAVKKSTKATAKSSAAPAAKKPPARSTPAKAAKPARTVRGTQSPKSAPAARSAPRKKAAGSEPAPTVPAARASRPATRSRSHAAGSETGRRAGAVKVAPPVVLDLTTYRSSLLALREATLAAYRNELRLGQEASDEPTEDIVDRANNAYTRELSFSISDAERTRLLQIEAALARIDQGTFGRCGHCGREIPEPRLQALPWAYLCVDCQDLLEKGLLVDA